MSAKNSIKSENMAVLTFALFLFSLTDGSAFSQTHHADLTQKASVVCSSHFLSHALLFYLDAVNDTIEAVYTVNASTYDESQFGTQTSPPTIAGDGTTESQYTFNITATGNPPDGLTLGEEAITANAEQLDPGVFTVTVMSKSIYSAPFFGSFVFPKDVIYTASCNFSETQFLLVSTGTIQVAGDITETPNQVQVSAALNVYESPPSQPVTSVALNTPIQLGIQATEPTRATGVYAHSCKLCDTAACDGILNIEFIDVNGCSVGSYISGFSSNSTLSLYTDTFLSFILPEGNSVFFTCRVNFCFVPGSPACIDYCAHNQGRRRKREASHDLRAGVTISTPLLITSVDYRVNRPTEIFLKTLGNRKSSDSDEAMYKECNTPMRAVVVALSILLIIGLVVSLVLWLRILQTRKSISANFVS